MPRPVPCAALVLGGALVLSACQAPPASEAAFKGAAPAAVAEVMDGVYSPVESNMFDPLTGKNGNPNFERQYPPYKPDWEARYVEQVELARQGRPNDPTSSCIPPGMPRVMTSPYALEMIVKPKQTTIVREYQSQVRRIYTDGSGFPEELEPSYNGYSIGHWEGDTLVAETRGMRGDTNYDRSGAPHSDQIVVVERIRMRSPDILEVQMTITDPVAFTKPWVVTRTYKREDWKVLDFACSENNRNPILPDGTTALLPSAGSH